MTSPDGITWTARTPASNNSWSRVRFGNGLFVAIAYSGTGTRVMTSTDGITWTTRTSAADNTWRSLAYGNGLWVAASTDGDDRVMTSTDGITWTSRKAAADQNWFGAAYGVVNGVGRFVFSSNNGTGSRIMTSGGELTTILPGGLADSGLCFISPTDGQSYTIPDNVLTYIVEPTANLSTLTIIMPANPYNGQVVNICFSSYSISALTHNPNSGQSLLDPITGTGTATFGRWEYRQSTATWYRTL
jgi:hypothetical protein